MTSMKYFSDYRFIVGSTAILSGFLALACIVTGTLASNLISKVRNMEC